MRIKAGEELELDRNSGQALYLQLAENFKTRISTGRWPPGTRLPGIRELAKAIALAPLTVHRTYQLLQSEGWIDSAPGRGSYVAEGDRTRVSFRSLTPDYTAQGIVQNYDKLDLIQGGRSLAIAGPDPQFFPGDWLVAVIRDLQQDSRFPFSLGLTAGEPGFRNAICEDLRHVGIAAEPEDVFVTSGSSQSLSLVAQILTRPGDAVAIDDPTLFRCLLTLRTHHLEIVPIPWDDEGPRLDSLQDAIRRKKIRFYYTTPTSHNPTGRTATIHRKRQILRLAASCDLQIIESVGCAAVYFDSERPPALRSLPGGEKVLMLETFSKVISSGIRVGYLLTPEPHRNELKMAALASGAGSSNLLQLALAKLLSEGEIAAHNRRVLPKYRARRDAMLTALSHEMPPTVQWTVPKGGFCLWLTLPETGQFDDLYESALQRGIIYTPGEALFVRAPLQRHLRLCYGSMTPEGICESVRILAELVSARVGS